jgi:hypothetical protein
VATEAPATSGTPMAIAPEPSIREQLTKRGGQAQGFQRSLIVPEQQRTGVINRLILIEATLLITGIE